MKEFSEYKNNSDCPVQPSFTTLGAKPHQKDFEKMADWGAAMDAWNENRNVSMKEYNSLRLKYDLETNRLFDEFRIDMGKDLGWDDLPARIESELHSMAYEKGHADGFSAIYYCGVDFEPLVVAIENALEEASLTSETVNM
jgi:hypothetical protein